MAKNKKLAGGVMTREQWLLKETRIVARMRLDGASEEEVVFRQVFLNKNCTCSI